VKIFIQLNEKLAGDRVWRLHPREVVGTRAQFRGGQNMQA